MAVIVVNTLSLFLLESVGLKNPWWRTFYWIDYVCVLYFLVEALLKISTAGWRTYWSNGWNKFDFLVVLLSAPVIFVSPTNELQFLANLLVLRLGRLFRLFRVLRFIPNMEHLVIGVRRALRASVGVFLALFLFNFILAMAATVMFKDVDPENFGSPLKSGYSIFKVFTVEGWYEIPDKLAKEVEHKENLDPITVEVGVRLFFVVSVLIGGILGLSLANAVFVDEMMMDNTHALEKKVETLTEKVDQLNLLLRDRESG
jgi:voltage-gated sodium channel